jgi:hypothetical protein
LRSRPGRDSAVGNQPRIAADLRDNPELLYDPNYRDAHPALDQYLANHPRVWANLNARHNSGGTEQSQFGSTAQPETGYGAYDSQHQWRDADWWYQYNSDWVWQGASQANRQSQKEPEPRPILRVLS